MDGTTLAPKPTMAEAASQAAEFLKLLANPWRLRILCTLGERGEVTVGGLAELLGVRDALVSQHLTLLRRDGLVRGRRDGQSIHYSLADGPAVKIIEALYAAFCPNGATP